MSSSPVHELTVIRNNIEIIIRLSCQLTTIVHHPTENNRVTEIVKAVNLTFAPSFS